MDEFNYLLRKRSAALGIFQKVLRKLQKLQDEINNLIANSKSEIEKAKQEIESHGKKLDYLSTTLTDTSANIAKIQEFVPQQASTPV